MEEEIFEVLLNSCYESISFYASICLYRTNPRNSKSGFFKLSRTTWYGETGLEKSDKSELNLFFSLVWTRL